MRPFRNVGLRLRDNWEPVARRMRYARKIQQRFDWGRFGLAMLGGLALVLATGIVLDERVIAWAATLPPGVTGFFRFMTRFGQSDWLLIPTGLLAIVVAFGDWRNVSRPVAAAWWEIGTFSGVLFWVVAATGLTTDIVKPLVGRHRPAFAVDGPFTFTPFSFEGYAHYSFPSGHATTMGAVAVLAAFAPGILTIPILVLTVIVAASRVMIGVHYPSDVVGGALIGVGLGYLILRGMADGGIVFVNRPGGFRRRFGVTRRFRRRAGAAALFRGLATAWLARTPRV